MAIRPHRTFRYYYLRFTRLKGDPEHLALGVAIGTFIGTAPVIPLNTILITIIAIACRASLLGGIVASWVVSNPFTFYMQYYYSWKVGAMILPSEKSWHEILAHLQTVWQDGGFTDAMTALTHIGAYSLFKLVLGGCIIAIPLTVIAYFSSLYYFKNFHCKKQKEKGLRCAQGRGQKNTP